MASPCSPGANRPRRYTRGIAAALAVCAMALAGSTAGSTGPDPILLSCTFPTRTIGGIVLFKSLKKLRIWYGDGGGEEWPDVDFTRDPIVTSTDADGQSIVLSGDYGHVIFNGEDDEHSFGDCRVAPVRGAPLWWFNPILKQEREYNRQP